MPKSLKEVKMVLEIFSKSLLCRSVQPGACQIVNAVTHVAHCLEVTSF